MSKETSIDDFKERLIFLTQELSGKTRESIVARWKDKKLNNFYTFVVKGTPPHLALNIEDWFQDYKEELTDLIEKFEKFDYRLILEIALDTIDGKNNFEDVFERNSSEEYVEEEIEEDEEESSVDLSTDENDWQVFLKNMLIQRYGEAKSRKIILSQNGMTEAKLKQDMLIIAKIIDDEKIDFLLKAENNSILQEAKLKRQKAHIQHRIMSYVRVIYNFAENNKIDLQGVKNQLKQITVDVFQFQKAKREGEKKKAISMIMKLKEERQNKHS
jgi:hypothetical protein